MLISIVETCVVHNAISVQPFRIIVRQSSVILNLQRLILTVDWHVFRKVMPIEGSLI